MFLPFDLTTIVYNLQIAVNCKCNCRAGTVWRLVLLFSSIIEVTGLIINKCYQILTQIALNIQA